MNFKRINLFHIFSALYFTLLIYSVFLARRRYNNIDYRTKLNIVTFKEKYNFLQQLTLKSIPLQKDFFIDLFGNVFMFIPLCFALTCLNNKDFSNQKLIALIILCSLTIEISQFIFNKGVPDIDDVIFNTAGGMLGISLKKITNRIKAH